MSREISERLAGMPGPPKEVIEQNRKLEGALSNLHAAMIPLLETMPDGAKLAFKKKIKGDWIKIEVQPDQGNGGE